MTKIVLSNLANLQNENTVTSAINSNNAIITAAVDNSVSRDGATPNYMLAELDMNSHRIINLPSAVSTAEPITLSQLNTILASHQVPNGLVTSGVPVSAKVQPLLNLNNFDTFGNYLGFFDSRAAAVAATIDATVNVVYTAGYYSLGDKGHCLYTRTGGSTTGGFQSADGSWWKIAINSSALNVRMFGAKGDGGSDDKVAFQDSITFISGLGGGTMHIPTGIFIISDTVSIPQRCGFIGEGDGTNVYISNATSNLFLLSGGSSFIKNMIIAAVGVRTSGAYIFLDNTTASSVIDSVFMSQGYYGVRAEGGGFIVNNCRISDTVTNGSGIYVVTTGLANQITNTSISSSAGASACLNIAGSGDILINNSQFLSGKYGLLAEPSVGFGIASLKVSNSIFDSNTGNGASSAAIYLHGTGNGIARCTFDNVEATSSSGTGILIAGAVNGIYFSNIMVNFNTGVGILLADTSVFNVFVNGGVISGNGSVGFDVAPNVTFFGLHNMRIGAGVGGGSANARSVRIQAGTSNWYHITNNNLQGNTAVLSDGGIGVNKVVNNNLE